MTERRTTARRRVCLGGHVRVAALLPAVDCILRDVSLGGARIHLAPETALPARFDLVVPCRNETRRARVVWRRGEAAGLSFEEVCAAEAPEAVLRRLAESEAEVLRLRAALSDPGPGSRDRLH